MLINYFPITYKKQFIRLLGVMALVTVYFFSPSSGYGQLNFNYQAGMFLIKGQVIDVQSKQPISLANIQLTNRHKGITCDNNGTFSMYVYPHDTLQFSSVGYMSKIIHVADLDSTNYYTLQIRLIHDFIKLKDVTIYPFSSKQEFEEAFMDAKHINEVNIPGIAKPKYTHNPPKIKITNPISFLYDRLKRKHAANPDFKP